jgi:hypothetical protein
MVHVNVIPLNPTGGFGGSPSQRSRVDQFVKALEEQGIACTPRVRRGIDIDAGCGQLTAKVLAKEQRELAAFAKNIGDAMPSPNVGVYEDADNDADTDDDAEHNFVLDAESVDFESDEWEDPEFETEHARGEAARLIALVQGTTINLEALGEAPIPLVRD